MASSMNDFSAIQYSKSQGFFQYMYTREIYIEYEMEKGIGLMP